KMEAIQFARERGIPFFGICLGMQCAAIEFARHVVGLEGAHSTEFSKDTKHPVICLLDEQRNITSMGGTMRLGAQIAKLVEGSKALDCYGKDQISERHRHRYEFNNTYRQQFAAHGMSVTGTSAVQYHPEFKSKPTLAQPLFAGFVKAAIEKHSARSEAAAVDA
ncbi:MAG: CTP synthetase, partial [Planctomycetales bacterium]|nr:CTP synthetase [Planctomycetales bacterium]